MMRYDENYRQKGAKNMEILKIKLLSQKVN